MISSLPFVAFAFAFSSARAAEPAKPTAAAKAAFARGVKKAEAKDDAAALKEFDAALAASPDFAEALSNRGWSQQRTGDVPGAIADFDGAIELDPNDGAALANRGMMLAAKGDKAGAEKDFKAAIAVFEKKKDNRMAAAAQAELEKLK